MISDFLVIVVGLLFFFFKQKTSYEMRISDWSSDVCSSDLQHGRVYFRVCLIAGASAGLVPDGAADLHQTLSARIRRRAGADAGDPRLARRIDSGPRSGELGAGTRRSDERGVGKECFSQIRYRGSPDP